MLGGLLGAYGSDEEEEVEAQQAEDAQQMGQVTLLRDEEEGGVDLSHLTSGAAAHQADAALGPAPAPAAAGDDQQPPRPQSAASEQDAGAAEGPTPMEADGQLQAVGGGGEQPPADPLSLLPPEMQEPPEGVCDPAVQARVANWLHLQRTRGKYINDEIRKSRGYRNPEFFAKMVEHLEIQQYGTSFAPEVFDPSALPQEDYLDALQKEWAAEEERRKAARAAGQGRVEFQKSASQPNLVGTTLKPGLNQPLQGTVLQPAAAHGAINPSAAALAKAAAVAAALQQHQAQQASSGAASALAAAQAKAKELAAQMMQRR